MKPCLILIFVLGSLVGRPQFCPAETGIDDTFHQANSAYTKGDFELAANGYLQLLDRYGYSGEVLYNLGNCYVQLAEPGKAILSYERARRLLPGDADVQASLQSVRKEQGLFSNDESGSSWFTDLFALDHWALLALVCLTAASLFCLAARWLTFGRRLFWSVLTGLMIGLTVAGSCAYRLYGSYDIMVVTGKHAKLLVSPFEGAELIATMQEGRLLKPLQRYGSFLYGRDENGRLGWLADDQVTAVLPKGGIL